MRTFAMGLRSRKLWVSVGSIIGCILTALCGEPDSAAQIAAIVGAVTSAVAYVAGEASIDRAAINKNNSNN